VTNRRADVAIELADALHYLHAAGLVYQTLIRAAVITRRRGRFSCPGQCSAPAARRPRRSKADRGASSYRSSLPEALGDRRRWNRRSISTAGETCSCVEGRPAFVETRAEVIAANGAPARYSTRAPWYRADCAPDRAIDDPIHRRPHDAAAARDEPIAIARIRGG
jgi:hypothetical protein